MTEDKRVRRRRRVDSHETNSDSILRASSSEPLTQEPLIDNTDDAFSTKPPLTDHSLLNPLDQIRADLADERRLSLTESSYWDDTHNWGTEASDDYWHFLGGYE